MPAWHRGGVCQKAGAGPAPGLKAWENGLFLAGTHVAKGRTEGAGGDGRSTPEAGFRFLSF